MPWGSETPMPKWLYGLHGQHGLHGYTTNSTVNLFKIKKIHGWWPFVSSADKSDIVVSVSISTIHEYKYCTVPTWSFVWILWTVTNICSCTKRENWKRNLRYWAKRNRRNFLWERDEGRPNLYQTQSKLINFNTLVVIF